MFYKYEAQLPTHDAVEVSEAFNLYGGSLSFTRESDAVSVITMEPLTDDRIQGLFRGEPKTVLQGMMYLQKGIGYRHLKFKQARTSCPWADSLSYEERVQRLLDVLVEPLKEPLPSWERDLDLFQEGIFTLATDLHLRLTSPGTPSEPVAYDERVIRYLRKRLAQWRPCSKPRSVGARMYVEGTLSELEKYLRDSLAMIQGEKEDALSHPTAAEVDEMLQRFLDEG